MFLSATIPKCLLEGRQLASFSEALVAANDMLYHLSFASVRNVLPIQ